MKKIGMVALILLIFIGVGFGYIYNKKINVQQSVIEYLTTEKNISRSDIIYSEPFIANLEGDKNWMVSIQLMGDDKTYYYYKSKNNVILESYVENGVEHVQ